MVLFLRVPNRIFADIRIFQNVSLNSEIKIFVTYDLLYKRLNYHRASKTHTTEQAESLNLCSSDLLISVKSKESSSLFRKNTLLKEIEGIISHDFMLTVFSLNWQFSLIMTPINWPHF